MDARGDRGRVAGLLRKESYCTQQQNTSQLVASCANRFKADKGLETVTPSKQNHTESHQWSPVDLIGFGCILETSKLRLKTRDHHHSFLSFAMADDGTQSAPSSLDGCCCGTDSLLLLCQLEKQQQRQQQQHHYYSITYSCRCRRRRRYSSRHGCGGSPTFERVVCGGQEEMRRM